MDSLDLDTAFVQEQNKTLFFVAGPIGYVIYKKLLF